MKEFLVGLLVIMMMGVLSVVGLLLFPLLLLLGFFLRWILGLILLLAGIWLVGKVTLYLIDLLGKRKQKGTHTDIGMILMLLIFAPGVHAAETWIDTHVHLDGKYGENVDFEGAMETAWGAMQSYAIEKSIVMPPPQPI